MERERRSLFRNGALLLLLSALIGLLVAAHTPHPAKWMTAHVSGIITGILVIALGGLWPELRLTSGTRHRAWLLGLTASWTGWALNLYAALVNLPGPATEPGRQPDAQWQAIVFLVGLVIVVPATLGSFFLVWRGLRDA